MNTSQQRSTGAVRLQMAGCFAALLILAAFRANAAGPADFIKTFNWGGLNNVAQTVSIEGNAQSNITAVVNVGNVNGDGYTDILLEVAVAGVNRYGLILGSDRRRQYAAGMPLDAPGLVRCWLVTSDASGGPHLMRARPIGDIDDDGYDDFCVIGSNSSSGAGNCNKWKYIVFGRQTWPAGEYDLGTTSTASPKDHIELHAMTTGDNFTRGGDYAAALGDLNGDGIDDMVLALPQWSYFLHSTWHDGSLQARFILGNATRSSLIFYAYDNANLPDAGCDKLWKSTPVSANQISGTDLDGDGRNEVLIHSSIAFPTYVWKASNFRQYGATPALDTPIPPAQWPGITNWPPTAVHSNEEDCLLSADAVIRLSGFGTQLLLTSGDVDGDGKPNLVWTDWATEGGWSGGEVVIATNFPTANLTGNIYTNTVQFNPKQNWLHRWTKLEGDGWFWGSRGLAYVGDMNRDGVGDLMVDDRFGDIGHGYGWTAGGVRFIAGSTTGWTITTRLTLPLILSGEHDGGDTAASGRGKNGDGLGSQIANIAGFGSSKDLRGFAVLARWWDPVGTNTADYGKLYIVSPFDSVPGTIITIQ